MKTSTCIQNVYNTILANERNYNVYINNLCKTSLWVKTKNDLQKKQKHVIFANICNKYFM